MLLFGVQSARLSYLTNHNCLPNDDEQLAEAVRAE